MIVAGVLGAALAAGVWLIARALVPPARPLRVLSDELATPRAAVNLRASAAGADPLRAWWRRTAGRLAGTPSPRLTVDLAVLHKSLARHTLDQLGYAAVFAAMVVLAAVTMPLAGVAMPLLPAGLAVLSAIAAGWIYPGIEVRSRAARARRSWGQTLTVYVDVVGISLAGGAGVEDALMTAARAGDGPQFAELAETLRNAQTRRRRLWDALEDLGSRGDIASLRELAAAIELAAEAGTRVRETLIAKAAAMRVRQLTDIEAEAQKSSETMGVAPALMAVAAVLLIGYPALARFFEG
ncbi:MAG: type II secretion system F family protein [Desertimonas sp.]